MTTPRLVAVDVDGTLLGSSYRLSPRTRDAVLAARAAGVQVTIATGRPYGALDELVELADWAITSNGSQAFHVATGDMPYAITFRRPAAEEFVHHARRRVPGVRFSLITDEDMGWEEGFDRFAPPGSPGTKVDDVLADVRGEVVMQLAAYHADITARDLEPMLQGIADADHLRAEFLGFPAVEIAPPSVDKAVALAWLTGHLGFGQDDVWAFGDGVNDLRMLSWAGQGFAMGNAPDDVKAVADQVTLTNDDHGVAVVLERVVATLEGERLMPKLTNDEMFSFLDEPGHLVRIGTIDADGMPRVVPLWFIRQDDDIVFTPRTPALVHVNLSRDPRVALSIDEEPTPYRKVTVQGTARLLHGPGEDDVWRDTYRAIATRYVPVEGAEAYIQNTIDQPRALYAVSLKAEGSKLSTWRMPVEGEDGTGIWHRRYYVDGTIMAKLADGTGA